VNELNATDYVSYSRFGNSVQRIIETLQPCNADTRRKLERAVQATDANMGGTEMEHALLDTFQISTSLINKLKNTVSDSVPPPFVLLITDGEIWNTDNVIAQCIRSEHRIFAVGVGSAPAENLLRQSAEKTGGACEFVAPNEDVTGAILRMFHRMRCSAVQNTKVDWGIEPVWQSVIPPYLYSGETLHVAALFDKPPAVPPQLTWERSGRTEKDAALILTKTENKDVVRLGGAKRLLEAGKKDTLPLALKYQLVCGQTAMFLVYERADKLTELPELHQIPQMHAAGWGGRDVNMNCRLRCACYADESRDVPSNTCRDVQPYRGRGGFASPATPPRQSEGLFAKIKKFMGFRAAEVPVKANNENERHFIEELLRATASCSNVEETKQRIGRLFKPHAPNALRTFLDEEQRNTGTDVNIILAVAVEELCKRYAVKPNRAVKQWLRVVLKDVSAETKHEIVQRFGRKIVIG
jgi:hypothetical protein